MGQVEPKRMDAQLSRQVRLSTGTIAKLHLARLDPQVATENHPERTTTDDEPPPVSLKAETPPSHHFIAGECLSQLTYALGRLFERCAPNMDIVVRQSRFRWRKIPVMIKVYHK
jgi:hypothetical protein